MDNRNEYTTHPRLEEGVTNKAFDAEEGEVKPRDSVVSFNWPEYIQGVFSHWYSPKKLKYGKPRLGESTLT